MNRAVIERQLEIVERHVALGAARIERQRELIAELEQNGEDAGEARLLLSGFEDLHRLHLAECDRLRRTLADAAS